MRIHPRSLRDRRAFVDSSAYLALLDRKDEHYQEAVDVVSALADQEYRQFTTNVLLIEAHALILSTLGIAPAVRFIRNLRQSKTVTVRVRQGDEDNALQLLDHYQDKDFSFTDAISFVVMERLGIHLAFTFDHHFAQYGFTILTPDLLSSSSDF
ncbi:MAG: type II toxin-antitoxin system VapC family toxin [Chloroflexota bacterium]